MIKIKIGQEKVELSQVDEYWINQQINRRRADGNNLCVRVIIKENDLNVRGLANALLHNKRAYSGMFQFRIAD